MNGTQNPLAKIGSGRWRKGEPCPDKGAFAPGNVNGYPSLEAYLAAKPLIEEKKKLKELKQMKKEAMIKGARNLQDLARDAAEEALEVIKAVMNDENAAPSARLQAAEMIHNRGYGKPLVTTINNNANIDMKPSEIDDTALDHRIRETLARVEQLTAREGKEATSQDRPTNIRLIN
jgi:hypothetical protein